MYTRMMMTQYYGWVRRGEKNIPALSCWITHIYKYTTPARQCLGKTLSLALKLSALHVLSPCVTHTSNEHVVGLPRNWALLLLLADTASAHRQSIPPSACL